MDIVIVTILILFTLVVYTICNVRILRLEERLQEVEKNMATINSISGEAIDAFGKFVEAIKDASDAAKIVEAAETAEAEQQKSEDNA